MLDSSAPVTPPDFSMGTSRPRGRGRPSAPHAALLTTRPGNCPWSVDVEGGAWGSIDGVAGDPSSSRNNTASATETLWDHRSMARQVTFWTIATSAGLAAVVVALTDDLPWPQTVVIGLVIVGLAYGMSYGWSSMQSKHRRKRPPGQRD